MKRIRTNKHNTHKYATPTRQEHLRAPRDVGLDSGLHTLTDSQLNKIVTKYEREVRGTESKVRKFARAIMESIGTDDGLTVENEDKFARAKTADLLLSRRSAGTNTIDHIKTHKTESTVASVSSITEAPSYVDRTSAVYDAVALGDFDDAADGTDSSGYLR